MSLSSISNQVNHALAKVTWDKEQIAKFKTEQGVASVKKSLRPGGDPTQPLPAILGINTPDVFSNRHFILQTRRGNHR